MARSDHLLTNAVRRALEEAGDPERAVAQQRYMKSEMPYWGFAAPRLKAVLRPLLASYAPGSREEWQDTVLDLWDGATHREERYAATTIARHRAARGWLDPEALPLFRHLIVSGAWWDHVDAIAIHLVGEVLAGHRTEVTPLMRAWAVDDNLWIRRTAVTCQVGDGAGTDRDLLRLAIEANLEDRTFWLRKAIGWGLRDLAWTDPGWVLAEVDRLGPRLSGLSRREAIKNLSRAPHSSDEGVTGQNRRGSSETPGGLS